MTTRPMTAGEVKAALLDRVKTEGVATALETALEVLRDPKASGAAKATMATLMFRVGGYLNENAADGEIDLSKMTLAEIHRFIEVATPELARLEKSIAAYQIESALIVVDDDDEADVFG